jgi:hypothetical protein
MDSQTFFTIVLSCLFAGGLAVGIYAMSIVAIEPKLARGGVWIAWLAGIMLCIWYGGTNDMLRSVRYTVAAAIAAALTVGLCSALDYIAGRESSQSAVPPHAAQAVPTLSHTDASALESLNNWLCEKDEGALRVEFDLVGILLHNIELMTKNHGPQTEKQEQFTDVFGDTRHMQFTQPIVVNGQYQAGAWRVNPGEIGILARISHTE